MKSNEHFQITLNEKVLYIKAYGEWSRETFQSLHNDVMAIFENFENYYSFYQILDLTSWNGTTLEGYDINKAFVRKEPVPIVKINIVGSSKIKRMLLQTYTENSDLYANRIFLSSLEEAMILLQTEYDFTDENVTRVSDQIQALVS